MMWRAKLAWMLLWFGALAFAPLAASAEAGLQVVPQKYQDVISGEGSRSGYIDVSNPSDTTVQIESLVQGFRQADLAGNLEFFDDQVLSAAIKVDLHNFEIGPREAVRVAFRVDPTKLPKGGVYGAIFFRTIPPAGASQSTYITESAKVGTLLLLENGIGEHTGSITQFKLPLWQFGNGFAGAARYRNTNRNPTAAAFAPELSTKVMAWSKPVNFVGPYVLPQSEREFSVRRTGSYFGILPLSLIDNASGQTVTRWAFVCTGWYAVGTLILIAFGLVMAILWLWRRFKRPKKVVVKRNFDGLSRKKG